MDKEIESKLNDIFEWAIEKSRDEPPWSKYQFMKLIEAIDYVLSPNTMEISDRHISKYYKLSLVDKSDEGDDG